jgi:multidrug efflux pump subunit AcrB
MNFATWSLRNPRPPILLFAMLCLAGILGFRALHVQYVPDLQLPSVRVDLSQPGAAPAELETEVARKVEDAVVNLQGVKHIDTAIVDGAVSLRVRYEIGKDRSDALIEVKDAVDRIRSQLPLDLDPPRVSAPFAFDDPVFTYSVSDDKMDEGELSWFVD